MPDATHMTALLTHYGYLAVLVGTFLEGETVLLIGATLAHEGYMSLFLVGLCAFAGGLASDQLMFALGRRYGPGFVQKRPHLHHAAERVAPLLQRHSTALILGFRFAYGLRGVVPLLVGMQGLSPRRFLALNALGAFGWAVIFSLLGYFLGAALDKFFGRLEPLHHALLFGLLLAVMLISLPVLRWRWRKRPVKTALGADSRGKSSPFQR